MPVKLPDSDPGKDPYKPQWRAFFITLNSCSSDLRFAHPLRVVWRYIVSHLSQFIIGRPKAKLLEVKEDHNVERGTKFHKIHLHSNLVFRTEGLSFLDLSKLRTFINANLRQVPGFVRCNLQIKLRKKFNEDMMIEDYINKDPLEVVPEEEFEIIPP